MPLTWGVSTASTASPAGPRSGEPLGHWFAARSGDKGGNANVGVFARDEAGYAWLREHLTAEAIRRLIPEAAELEVRRYELANLHALNIVLVGYLGEGVASSTAFDTQAKGLGEYLRSRVWPPRCSAGVRTAAPLWGRSPHTHLTRAGGSRCLGRSRSGGSSG
ncbi:MAG: hypothetical protein R2713_18470 [Ilumatobacteraceae bacterium]